MPSDLLVCDVENCPRNTETKRCAIERTPSTCSHYIFIHRDKTKKPDPRENDID